MTNVENLDYMKETSARSICRSLLSAVEYLHSRPIPIAHRDIKLENILLVSKKKDFSSESLRLADFGFAKEEVYANSFITMCGTPAYVAPEILLQKQYGRIVDLWSVGVVAYSLLAGYQPFHAEEESDVEKLIVKGEYDFDNDYWKDVSDEAKEFIRSLLVTDPDERTSAKKALKDPWFSKDLKDVDTESAGPSKPQVFFMIGSQVSHIGIQVFYSISANVLHLTFHFRTHNETKSSAIREQLAPHDAGSARRSRWTSSSARHERIHAAHQ